jgi:hypothetical protein
MLSGAKSMKRLDGRRGPSSRPAAAARRAKVVTLGLVATSCAAVVQPRAAAASGAGAAAAAAAGRATAGWGSGGAGAGARASSGAGGAGEGRAGRPRAPPRGSRPTVSAPTVSAPLGSPPTGSDPAKSAAGGQEGAAAGLGLAAVWRATMTDICGGASSWQSEAAACPGELLGGQILPQAGLPVLCSLRGSRRRGQSSPAAAVAAATRGPITAAGISRRRRVKVGILCILRAARLLNTGEQGDVHRVSTPKRSSCRWLPVQPRAPMVVTIAKRYGDCQENPRSHSPRKTRTFQSSLDCRHPAQTLLPHHTFCVHSLHAWAIAQGLMKSIK